MAAALVRAGSKATVAFFVSKSILTDWTPGTRRIDVFTAIGQVAHVIFATEKVCIRRAAVVCLAGAAKVEDNGTAAVPTAIAPSARTKGRFTVISPNVMEANRK